jgi:HEAT repeat protein
VLLLLAAACDVELQHAREALKSPVPALRADALRVLARRGSAADLDLVEPLVSDGSPRVRRQAVAALGALGPGPHLNRVVGRLRDADLEVRLAAVRVLGDSGNKSARRVLMPLLLDPSQIVRRAAAAALGDLGLDPADQQRELASLRLQELVASLRRGDDQVRASAARELGLSGRKQALPPLRRLLEDPSPRVSAAAARAVARISGRPAPAGPQAESAGASPPPISLQQARALVAAHLRQASSWIPESHWNELRGQGPASRPARPPGKRSGVERILSGFPERAPGASGEDPLLPPATPLSAVRRALRQVGGQPGASGWLAGLARDPQVPSRVRALALETLADHAPSGPDAQVGAAVRQGLASADPRLRRAAARACHLLGDGALRAGLKLLEERDFDQRAAGARCLGRAGDRAAVAPLIKMLQQEQQLAAIRALARLGDRRAVAPLAALLREDHPVGRQGERLAVVQALGRLGGPEAAPALERELSHPAWEVRLAAARALAAGVGRPASRGPLRVCLEDFYADVRAACRRALGGLSGGK